MVRHNGRQKGPQRHAEGQHGDKTHERFREQIHESKDRDEEPQRDADGEESEERGRDGERR